MILTSTAASIPYTPPWLEKQPDCPVFHLRAGTVIERGMMEAELSGPYRARLVLGYEMRLEMTAGVQALLVNDPGQDRVLGVIAAAGEAEAEGKSLPPDDVKLLEEVAAVLTEHWPPYRDLAAQTHRRREITPIVALRRYCTGWDRVTGDNNQPVPFERGPDGLVTEEAMAALSRFEMMVAGRRAYALQFGGAQAGNSGRPDQSGSSPKPTNSDARSKAAGISKASAGPKTRASRSPRRSGQSSTSG